MNLLGLDVEDACNILEKSCIKYKIINYLGPKPYNNADCQKIVRIKKQHPDYWFLTICSFKSKPDN